MSVPSLSSEALNIGFVVETVADLVFQGVSVILRAQICLTSAKEDLLGITRPRFSRH